MRRERGVDDPAGAAGAAAVLPPHALRRALGRARRPAAVSVASWNLILHYFYTHS